MDVVGIKFYNKEYKKWLRVATVELNGYFKVSDFHSVLQTFFPANSHILMRYLQGYDHEPSS
jgi:hypothetical protein